ncbi:hypothetical protein JKP88DRAFT_244615 [Tribonema minus]|uniref:Uncharacterized protein n=1 Tax=Tribonema minus TaxID=303371 RepID=A0A835Z1M0_9STRA|nr:hypothetical protein JKP88DRAFT_244615 [Tribonema minus]
MDIANFNTCIRVDNATQMGSVIDVINLINPYESNAPKTLTRLPQDLIAKCSQLRINGKGKLTPCADAQTLVEVVWSLPGKAARDFRRESAKAVCRVLGGDLTLADEIEARHHALQGSDEGQAAQAFMLADSDDSGDGFRTTKRVKSLLPDELQLATAEQQSAYFDGWMVDRNADRKMVLQKRQFDNTSYFMSEMERQDMLDPALRIAMIDTLKNIATQDATSTALVAVAVAAAPPDEDYQTVAGWLLKYNPKPNYQKTTFTTKMGMAVSSAYRVKHGHPNTQKTSKHVNGEVRPVMMYDVRADGELLTKVFNELTNGAV